MTADRATSVFNFTLVPSNIAKHFAIVWLFFLPCTDSRSLILRKLFSFLLRPKAVCLFVSHSLAHTIKHALTTTRITWSHQIKSTSRLNRFAFSILCSLDAFVLHQSIKVYSVFVMRRSDLMNHDDGNGHIIDGVSFTTTLCENFVQQNGPTNGSFVLGSTTTLPK